jgi:predicted DNA-binding transcriptional regulator AlpA
MLKLARSLPLNSYSSESTHKETASSSSVTEHLLRPDELAQQLNVSPRTLARWHSHRHGPPRLRVGRAIFYDVSAVREWLRSRNEHGSRINERRQSRPPAARQ